MASFSVIARFQSFRYAPAGLWLMLRTQHNAWVHLLNTVFVGSMGLALNVSRSDWRWLITAIVLVWVAEIFNTAFGHLCDVVSPDFHHSVQKSKDIAAGAVLICTVGAVCLGTLTFWPYLFALFAR